MIIFEYDTDRWPLRQVVERCLGERDLERLHELPLPDPEMDPAEHGLLLSDRLRAALDHEALEAFASFVRTALPPVVGAPVLRHQHRPVMRVHMHGGHSISGMHRDRDWGQSPDVWNLWVPFTDVWGTNSIWIESREGADDAEPVALRLGEALIFRGADLRHGSIRNDTGRTRVSCDIRFARH
jgi:ectoine hydroxylase-related dioxygenase (phytanoyl-CoA dioxygenase family)